MAVEDEISIDGLDVGDTFLGMRVRWCTWWLVAAVRLSRKMARSICEENAVDVWAWDDQIFVRHV